MHALAQKQRPLCGEASGKDGATGREIDDTLLAAVGSTVGAHFAIPSLVRWKGKGRDRWPTSRNLQRDANGRPLGQVSESA